MPKRIGHTRCLRYFQYSCAIKDKMDKTGTAGMLESLIGAIRHTDKILIKPKMSALR